MAYNVVIGAGGRGSRKGNAEFFQALFDMYHSKATGPLEGTLSGAAASVGNRKHALDGLVDDMIIII
jgi:hypothetical protein